MCVRTYVCYMERRRFREPALDQIALRDRVLILARDRRVGSCVSVSIFVAVATNDIPVGRELRRRTSSR